MQEYVGFSFKGFGEEKVVNSLRQYLEHVDYAYDFDGFEHVNHCIAKDSKFEIAKFFQNERILITDFLRIFLENKRIFSKGV